MKTAASHIASLRDGREIYFNGKRVADVTTHPAFRNAVRSVAGLYDLNGQHSKRLPFESPTSRNRVSYCWHLPTSYRELVQRRRSLAFWADHTLGMMGRSPDHVA